MASLRLHGSVQLFGFPCSASWTAATSSAWFQGHIIVAKEAVFVFGLPCACLFQRPDTDFDVKVYLAAFRLLMKRYFALSEAGKYV